MDSNSSSPSVAFQNQCSILHNNVLYVYQPNAFQTLDLTNGSEWKQQTNGVSVTGAVCVKGGIDGDSTKPALYVVGGTTNSSTTGYTGLQRYSIEDNTWTTITPLVTVTSQRLNHGATYLNASSALLVYGGSQNGNAGPSTETFLMLMYPPYRVQSYPSTAPPVVNPTMLQWSDSDAVMVGGSTTNQKVFTFNPNPGWVDIGLSLPAPLPDPSVAKSSLATLDDGSKILFTFDMSQSPNTVRRTVLLTAGGLPAAYNQPIGAPVATTASGAASAVSSTAAGVTQTSAALRFRKRTTILNNFPAYNSSSASDVTRTNFALAQGQNDITAIIGGDANSTIEFFNKFENTWQPPSYYLGSQQQPLTASTSSAVSSSTSVPSSTFSQLPTAKPSSSSPAAVPQSNSSNGLTILGGVLGGVCGLAAILIILLLYLRQVRRRKQMAAAQKGNPYSEDKPSFEEQGLQPLSRQAQPMGRSPVTSVAMEDRDSIAMFGSRSEKAAELSGVSARHQLGVHNNGSGIGFGFKREKSPLTISKPMMPDLGDYQARPSIELGKATPITPTVAVDTGLVTALPEAVDATKKDQRKTDEGWAKYFSAEKESEKRETALTVNTDVSTLGPPPRSARGGFWPGSGVPEPSTRSPSKGPLRDSEGRSLTAQKVVMNSPSLSNGASDMKTRTMSTAEGMEAKISSADSISTDVTDDDDDDYEDERMTAYSSGVPESVHDSGWTPVGNSWSAPPQHTARPPSDQVQVSDFPPPPTSSVAHPTAKADSKSSLPSFPMPGTAAPRVQPSGQPHPGISFAPGTRLSSASSMYGPARVTSEDYFSRSIHLATTVTPQVEPIRHKQDQPQQSQLKVPANDPNDMSWINLGTPAGGTPAHQQSPDPQQPNV